jgi:hypothetical protein
MRKGVRTRITERRGELGAVIGFDIAMLGWSPEKSKMTALNISIGCPLPFSIGLNFHCDSEASEDRCISGDPPVDRMSITPPARRCGR